MSSFLLSIAGRLPGPFLELGARVGIWFLKRAAAKEEEVRLFEEGIRALFRKHEKPVKAAEDEAASRERLAKQLEQKP